MGYFFSPCHVKATRQFEEMLRAIESIVAARRRHTQEPWSAEPVGAGPSDTSEVSNFLN